MEPAVTALPPAVAAAASDSIGAALAAGGRLGAAGPALVAAARVAYVDAMTLALLVAAGVAVAGGLLALLFLPSRAAAERAPDLEPSETPELEPSRMGG